MMNKAAKAKDFAKKEKELNIREGPVRMRPGWEKLEDQMLKKIKKSKWISGTGHNNFN